MLYRMIAYRLQAERLGDLDRDTQRFLDEVPTGSRSPRYPPTAMRAPRNGPSAVRYLSSAFDPGELLVSVFGSIAQPCFG
jgi:hypothetical protein